MVYLIINSPLLLYLPLLAMVFNKENYNSLAKIAVVQVAGLTRHIGLEPTRMYLSCLGPTKIAVVHSML